MTSAAKDTAKILKVVEGPYELTRTGRTSGKNSPPMAFPFQYKIVRNCKTNAIVMGKYLRT